MQQSVSSARPVVLTFSASDPTAGAGLQGDLLTIAALGAHPLSVLTGVSLQDTAEQEEIDAIDPDWVAGQARVLLEDIPVQAFRIGVLASVENVAAVAEVVADYPGVPVVFDPVFSSARADALTDEEMLAAMSELLLPLTTVLPLTANEARRFAQEEDEDEELDAPACARHLIELGVGHVLITGVHEHTPQVVNTLYGALGVVRRDVWERLPGNYHGAGATLASALAVMLARGLPVQDAVYAAQEFTWQALVHADRFGMGQMIPDRFFRTS